MRKAALVTSLLLLSGCSGFGKWLSDTATLPGENPNAPSGDSENLRRAKGYGVAEQPVLEEGGNVWPGPPPPLPTLADVAKEHNDLTEAGPNSLGGTLGALGPELKDGSSMSVGDQQSFSGQGLPASEPDAAKGLAVRPQSATIQIPNGDGSTTLIHPDGTVQTIKSGAAPSSQTGQKAASPAPQP
ncbi:hypothetical protein LOC54_09200 [Acetobacter sp. AN02]|uniref:hypothetical protein n=1 Tax=Acetobacter sp. AN02 TaxID=2894186 RepID=UPI0024345671|nr:hypothetical protein [Acetobacter sp. AN02]MDG6095277.1 hypothetical protein [Acetobacter sp. AN02]